MPNPTAAMLVIGDEILSGRTQDTNTHHLAGALTRVLAGAGLRGGEGRGQQAIRSIWGMARPLRRKRLGDFLRTMPMWLMWM